MVVIANVFDTVKGQEPPGQNPTDNLFPWAKLPGQPQLLGTWNYSTVKFNQFMSDQGYGDHMGTSYS